MCIFSRPVTSVNRTRIFARRTSGSTQFLVYQMNYDSPGDNAMILPVPIRQPAEDGSLRFIDLQAYNGFFDDLAKGFPFVPPIVSIGCSKSAPSAAATLQVHTVGNYIASFVPAMADFSRLDNRFTLPADTWSQIPQYARFGFAVFQLSQGSLTPHPMAFEFETADEGLYFPTLHIHDGAVHETERFDHLLYLQHAGLDSQVYGYRNCNMTDRNTGLARSKYAASQFCDVAAAHGVVSGNLLVHRREIRGRHPNRDVTISVSGDPVRPSFNWRPWLNYSPWLVVAAGITWFFARRGRLQHDAREIA